MVDDFVARKHGTKKVSYDLPQLEPVLKETYGVIVYQEQVMEIAMRLAGYSLGEGDILRRAMGKKTPGHEPAKGALSGGRPGKGHTPRKVGRSVRPHRKIRGLRLQQVPLRRLCPHRLSDRLPQGPLPAGVHGRAAHQRGQRHRQGHGPYRRVPRARPHRAATGHQPLGHRLHRGRQRHPLRPGRGKERGARRGGGHHRRSGTRRRVQRPARPVRAGGFAQGQPPSIGEPGQVRGL